MKQRDFALWTTFAAFAVAWGRAAADPCPVPLLSVDGGSSVSTPCTAPTPGTAPAWFINAQEGVWTAVASASNQTIKSAVQTPIPSNPGSSPASITSAWTGGAVDQGRGEYMMCANGGHSDYPGNECYAISLRSETPAWRRLSDSTPQEHIRWDDNVSGLAATHADGRPRAMHSTFECFGDGRVWFPEQNSYASPSGNTMHAVISYNRDMLGEAKTPLAWTSANLGPWTIHAKPDFKGEGPTPTAFGRAAWDRVTRKVWAFGGNNNMNNPYYWSVSTAGATLGQSTVYRKSVSLDNFNGWMAIAPDLRIAVLGGSGKNSIWVFNIDQAGSSSDWQQITNVTGTPFFQSGSGGAYIEANKTIAIGNPKNTGSRIYKLRIPTKLSGGKLVYDAAGSWAWTTLNPGGATVSVPNDGSNYDVYSKWNIVEDMGNGQAAIVVTMDYAGPTYVYKVPRSGL